MSQLRLENFKFGYQQSLVAHPLNLECGSGDVPFSLGIWGSNGSGKTTLLKTLAGLMPPFQGRVLWGPGLRLAFVPQELGKNFYVPLMVREVLMQMSHPEANFENLVTALEVGTVLDKTWEELSRGQKQKVLIARALMKKPDVLLLDEPFSALDQNMSEKIRDFLCDFKKEKSLILIDHQEERLKSITDQIIRL